MHETHKEAARRTPENTGDSALALGDVREGQRRVRDAHRGEEHRVEHRQHRLDVNLPIVHQLPAIPAQRFTMLSGQNCAAMAWLPGSNVVAIHPSIRASRIQKRRLDAHPALYSLQIKFVSES